MTWFAAVGIGCSEKTDEEMDAKVFTKVLKDFDVVVASSKVNDVLFGVIREFDVCFECEKFLKVVEIMIDDGVMKERSSPSILVINLKL